MHKGFPFPLGQWEDAQTLMRAQLKLIYFNYEDKEKPWEAAGWPGRGQGLQNWSDSVSTPDSTPPPA